MMTCLNRRSLAHLSRRTVDNRHHLILGFLKLVLNHPYQFNQQSSIKPSHPIRLSFSLAPLRHLDFHGPPEPENSHPFYRFVFFVKIINN